MIASYFLPILKTWELRREVARVSALVDGAELELAAISPEFMQELDLNRRIRTVGDTIDQATLSAWEERLKELDPVPYSERPIEEREQSRQFTEKLTEINADNSELQVLAQQIETMARWGKIGLSVGVLMTIVGFGLWFFRTQRYQDAILLQRARKTERGSADSSEQ